MDLRGVEEAQKIRRLSQRAKRLFCLAAIFFFPRAARSRWTSSKNCGFEFLVARRFSEKKKKKIPRMCVLTALCNSKFIRRLVILFDFILGIFGRCLFIVSRACYVYRGNCPRTNQTRPFCQSARSLFYCRLLYYLGLGEGCARPRPAVILMCAFSSQMIGAGGARIAAMGKCQKIILYFRGRWVGGLTKKMTLRILASCASGISILCYMNHFLM